MKKRISLLALVLTTFSYAQDKLPSHAVAPGDIFKAACQSSFNEIDYRWTKKKIYMELRGKGHNLKAYLNNPSFTLENFREIYRAVMLMPSWVKLGDPKSETGIKYTTNDHRDGVASYGRNKVTINVRRWKQYGSSMRTAILFHELAHAIGGRIGHVDDSKAWENLGGWVHNSRTKYRKNGSIYDGSTRKPFEFVSEYAWTNPAEDFAESISAYRVNPQMLKDASMDKYNFIKDVVFFGKEFTDDSNCNLVSADVVDHSEAAKHFESRLKSNRHYDKGFSMVRKRLDGLKNPHPNAVKRMYVKSVMLSVISSVTNIKIGKKEDFEKVHKLRLYMKEFRDYEKYLNAYGLGKIRKYLK